MLQFLQPAGLLALSALALPALLHLWRKPTQTVRLGSLRFLQNVPQRRLRNLRWQEHLLLTVRLLLLALMALWLAQPRWQPVPSAAPQRWALLDPNAILEGSVLDQWRARSAAGYEMRQMAPGFLPITSSDREGRPLWREKAGIQPDLWSLLREADLRLTAGSRIAVFSSGRLSNLRGERPKMQHGIVEWFPTNDRFATKTQIWLESLELLLPSASKKNQWARARLTVSNAASTRSVMMLIEKEGRAPVPGEADWEVETARQPSGAFAARWTYRDDGEQRIGPWVSAAPEKAKEVIIGFDANRADDARYVKAAVIAVREADGGHPIHIVSADARNLTETLPDKKAETPGDLIFWLSDKPIPPTMARTAVDRGANIVYDARETSAKNDTSSSSVFVVPSDVPNAASFADDIRLWRRTPAQISAKEVTFWQDGFGQPLLAYAPKQNGGGEWHFQSRVHPDWNDLPRTGALADWIHQLILGKTISTLDRPHDLRLADQEQTRPTEELSVTSVRLEPSMVNPRESKNLQPVLWWAAIGVFALERALSHRRASAVVSAARSSFTPLQPREVTRP